MFNGTIKREYLMKVFTECHNMFVRNNIDYTFNIHRIDRSSELDYKFFTRCILLFDKTDIGIVLKFNYSIYSDSITLRSKKYLNIQPELVLHMTYNLINSYIEEEKYPVENVDIYNKIIDRMIEFIKKIKVCVVCRCLHKNSDDYCIGCIFDKAFSNINHQCVICQDEDKDEIIFNLTCGHGFHSKCILQHFITTKNRICPICREIDIYNTLI